MYTMAAEQAIASVYTQHDTTQQMTAPIPATKIAKYLRWVAAG